MSWTYATLQAYAPNALVLNRARALFYGRRWEWTASDGDALWGLCKSTGELSYPVLVTLDGKAFHCTCKNRYRPCQHVLSLLLFFLRKNDQITPTDERPEWVRAAIRQPEARKADVIDAAQQEARLAKRIEEMKAGVEELDQWLRDLVRQGLSSIETAGPEFWERIAARMVDAKLGSVARRIRSFPNLLVQEQWHDELLGALSELYLFVQSFRQLEGLPAALQEELLSYGGVNIKKEEVLEEPSVSDRWLVVGLVEGEEEKLRYRRTWLVGEQTGRFALILDFVWGNGRFDGNWVLGSALQGELVFYPGTYPLRALLKRAQPYRQPMNDISLTAGGQEMLQGYAQALAQNPWLSGYPVLLGQVQAVWRSGEVVLLDARQMEIPVQTEGEHQWVLYAVSAREPVTVFGEWNGKALRALSVLGSGRVVQLQGPPPSAFDEADDLE
ncbi:MAG: hypothetical protein RIC19_07580 [Phaeodactylibacter sp.]|uniref:hypothetical protein n=1 Tax=Phaeodactylibacter sp. TaxID=1940289 RepID=UPI0032ECCFEE